MRSALIRYVGGWRHNDIFLTSLRILKASAPAVDPDYVKKQLKNQKQMNEDIAVMKARLRDAAADAQKVTRALGDEAGGQDSLLASKIEVRLNIDHLSTWIGDIIKAR